jgi:hypothetical protein
MIKPTLGYPTRTAAIEAFLADGMEPRGIAAKLDVSLNSVQQLIYLSERRLADRKIVLTRPMIDLLGGEAARRGTSAAELAHRLLELIVHDDLFDALLGEAGVRHG